jgi:hypothetical protein
MCLCERDNLVFSPSHAGAEGRRKGRGDWLTAKDVLGRKTVVRRAIWFFVGEGE